MNKFLDVIVPRVLFWIFVFPVCVMALFLVWGVFLQVFFGIDIRWNKP